MHELGSHLENCFLDSIKHRPLAELPPADVERLWELARASVEANQLEEMHEDAVYGMELLCEIIDAYHKALVEAIGNGDWSNTVEADKMTGLLREIEVGMRTFDNEAPEHSVPETSETDIGRLRKLVQPEPKLESES